MTTTGIGIVVAVAVVHDITIVAVVMHTTTTVWIRRQRTQRRK